MVRYDWTKRNYTQIPPTKKVLQENVCKTSLVEYMHDYAPHDINHVRTLMAYPGAINEKGHTRHTALIYAAGWGEYDIVKLLVENGANVNIAAGSTTALSYALDQEYDNIVNYLVINGAVA